MFSSVIAKVLYTYRS